MLTSDGTIARRHLPALLVQLCVLLAASPARAMDIGQFERLAQDDQNAYLSDLIWGAARTLEEDCKPDAAAQVRKLFVHDIGAQDADTREGTDSLGGKLIAMSARATNAPQSASGMRVEDALRATLREKGIALPDRFAAEGTAFKPKLPPAGTSDDAVSGFKDFGADGEIEGLLVVAILQTDLDLRYTHEIGTGTLARGICGRAAAGRNGPTASSAPAAPAPAAAAPAVPYASTASGIAARARMGSPNAPSVNAGDSAMPVYRPSQQTVDLQLRMYCAEIYSHAPPATSPDQQRARAAQRTACSAGVDFAELASNRKAAVRYCFANNYYVGVGNGDRLAAYDECMNQHDELTALCTKEIEHRASYTPDLEGRKCSPDHPEDEEAALLVKGTDERGAPLVPAAAAPELPALVGAWPPGIAQPAAR